MATIKAEFDGRRGIMRSMLFVLRSFVNPVRQSRVLAAGLFVLLALAGVELLAQQPGNNPPGQNIQKAAIGPPGNQQNQNPLFAGPNMNLGQTNNSRGAAANADFDSLIDLIEATVANETWAENGGGTAEIRPFPGGVLVDAGGMLRLRTKADSAKVLTAKRGTAPAVSNASGSARQASGLRFVSLPRLEREMIRRQRAHQPFDPAMLTLAG